MVQSSINSRSSGQTRKYRVISMSYEKLKSVGKRLGGASTAKILRSEKKG